jgi:hypothetical protein
MPNDAGLIALKQIAPLMLPAFGLFVAAILIMLIVYGILELMKGKEDEETDK